MRRTSKSLGLAQGLSLNGPGSFFTEMTKTGPRICVPEQKSVPPPPKKSQPATVIVTDTDPKVGETFPVTHSQGQAIAAIQHSGNVLQECSRARRYWLVKMA